MTLDEYIIAIQSSMTVDEYIRYVQAMQASPISMGIPHEFIEELKNSIKYQETIAKTNKTHITLKIDIGNNQKEKSSDFIRWLEKSLPKVIKTQGSFFDINDLKVDVELMGNDDASKDNALAYNCLHRVSLDCHKLNPINDLMGCDYYRICDNYNKPDHRQGNKRARYTMCFSCVNGAIRIIDELHCEDNNFVSKCFNCSRNVDKISSCTSCQLYKKCSKASSKSIGNDDASKSNHMCDSCATKTCLLR